MVLRAREVLEEAAVVLGRHDSKIEAKALLRDHGRLRVAPRGDLEHPRQRHEVADQRSGIRRGRDHVEVTERLATAPHAPGPRDLDRRRMLAQRLDDLAHDREPDAQQAAPLGLGPEALVERGEDLLLALRPETLERPHPLLLGRLAQLVEGRHVELAPDARRRLGAEPRNPQELRHLARHLGPSLLERCHVAGLRQLDDLRLDRASDPRQLLRPTSQRELRDRRSRLAHPGRRPPVGDDAEALLSEDLRDVRELVERVRDVAVAREGRHPPIIGLSAKWIPQKRNPTA